MEEKKIITVTAEQMKNHHLDQAQGIHYKGFFLQATQRPENDIPIDNIFKYPYRIPIFFLILCKRGHGKISINLDEYEIEDNTLVINIPNSIIQLKEVNETSSEGVIFGIDPQNTPIGLEIDTQKALPLLLALQQRPVFKLSEKQCDKLQLLLKGASEVIKTDDDDPFKDEIIRSYFALFFSLLCSILNCEIKAHPTTETSVKSRNDEYFAKFLRLVAQHHKSERQLSFYASELCITPKYLTTLIKRVSGITANEWINRYVILEAKNLLRFSNLSIQEIAYELNFPNQSFFGKYFKQQTGYTPSAYKLQK